jgi:hypothetical protein
MLRGIDAGKIQRQTEAELVAKLVQGKDDGRALARN